MGLNTDFYVRDKESGRIHKVGTDQHDSIWVDTNGELHYCNLQNGDGCSGKSIVEDGYGYEFVPAEGASIDDWYFDKYREECEKAVGGPKNAEDDALASEIGGRFRKLQSKSVESVPVKELCEWLSGYCAPPESQGMDYTRETFRECWERWFNGGFMEWIKNGKDEAGE